MNEVATARSALPWSQRVCEAANVSPAWLGVAVAAALCSAFLAVERALGRFAALAASSESSPYRDFRLAFVNFLLLAWGPTAYAYAARGARETRRALRPVFAGNDAEWAAIEAEAGTYPRGALCIAGLIGAVAALLSPLFTASAATTPPYGPALWNPEVVWHRWTAPAIGWFGGRFSYALLEEGRRLSALAARLGPIGSTLVRVALYVLLPLGSWLGGAFAERLLGRILD